MKFELNVDLQNVSNFHFNENLGFYFFNGEFDTADLGKINYLAKIKLVTSNWGGNPTKIIRSISFFIDGGKEINDNYYQNVYLKVNNEFKKVILKVKNDRNKLIDYISNNDIPSVLHEPIKISDNYTICEDMEDEEIGYYDEEADDLIELTVITEEDEDFYVDGPEDPQEWFDHPYTYLKVKEGNLAYTKDGKMYIIKDEDVEMLNELWKKKGQEEEENREPPEPPEPDYDDYY